MYTIAVYNPFVTKYYCVLLDVSFGTVLTIGSNISAMIFLSECIPDTYFVPAVQYPNYEASFGLFFISSIKPKDYPTWTWSNKIRKFIKTNKEMLNDDIFTKSELANSKRRTFDIITNSVSQSRYKIMSGTSFQETVYLTKKQQAQTFKESGYDEKRAIEFPYVLQYADFADISLRQAAEDILLKSSFDDDILLKTELLRLKYLKKLKEETQIDKLSEISKDFEKDFIL